MKVILLGFLSLFAMIGVLNSVNFFSIFLIILPLPLGYLLKIIKTSFKGSDELPDFDNWKSMYLNGIKLILTVIIYFLPIIILVLILNPSQIFSLFNTNFSLYNLWSMFLGSIGQIIIFIAIGVMEYVGIANMALYDGEISAAFRFREIINRIAMIGWKKYLISYLIIWILGFLTFIISILMLFILIGLIIIPLIIIPYFMTLNARFLALIFASSES
ncbi:MAG: DUF4013 domain-containing protein [Methanothermobacter sp.]